jgi:hypothetical protein
VTLRERAIQAAGELLKRATGLPDPGQSATPKVKPTQGVPVTGVEGRFQKFNSTPGIEQWQNVASGDSVDPKSTVRTGLRSRAVVGGTVLEDAQKGSLSSLLAKPAPVLSTGHIAKPAPAAPTGPTDFSTSTATPTLSIRG